MALKRTRDYAQEAFEEEFPTDVRLRVMVESARREMRYRERNFPRFIQSHRLSPEIAKQELVIQAAILALLERLETTPEAMTALEVK